ncbi:hypothetical protein ACP4OV_012081 [Aristida adscensionis]
MAMVRAATRRRRTQGGVAVAPAPRVDRLSDLPDEMLADIVARLPARDGARTQVLSKRWLPLWRAAPLNLDLGTFGSGRATAGDVSRILAAHPGPGRRFSVGSKPCGCCVARLAGWLRSPALRGLQVLEIQFHAVVSTFLHTRRPPLPAPALGFFSTLRVASFGRCRFPGADAIAAAAAGQHGGVLLPRLEQLIPLARRHLGGVLARRARRQPRPAEPAAGSQLRVGDERDPLEHIVIQDAPNLERLVVEVKGTQVSVISAPKLEVLGPLYEFCPRLQLGNTVFVGLHSTNLTKTVNSVRVLALEDVHLSLDLALDFIRCFPFLEQLCIMTTMPGQTNVWCRKYRDLTVLRSECKSPGV